MPRPGPCSPWVNGDDVYNLPVVRAAVDRGKDKVSTEEARLICARVAIVATNVLYERSARIFTGECGPVTIRPIARPADVDTRFFLSAGLGWGYSGSWGMCNRNALGVGAVATHFGCTNPPEIEFNVFPVNTIESVYIDGVLIPPDEYELRDHKTLVRLRPTASFSPTQRWGWPTCQIEDLPPDQPGTFSVTFTYGQDPGEGGREAARALARELALANLKADGHKFPMRTTSVARQGVDVQTASVLDLFKNKQTGIYEADLWLSSVNPDGLSVQSLVWSPDIVRNRRVPGVTL